MTLYQLANRSRQEQEDYGRRLVSVEEAVAARPVARQRCGIAWLDLLLGGGFPRGAVIMLHGEPGAGKSTLLAQACGGVRGAVYVSAEEDIGPLGARFKRLGLRCDLLVETDIASALATVGKAPPLVVIDSVQGMRSSTVVVAQAVLAHARANRVAVVIVCQEIKSGRHAGPMELEHLVDASVKMGRGYIAVEKNRYGPAGISLITEMTEKGLQLQ